MSSGIALKAEGVLDYLLNKHLESILFQHLFPVANSEIIGLMAKIVLDLHDIFNKKITIDTELNRVDRYRALVIGKLEP